MKKFINRSEDMMREVLQGYQRVHQNIIKINADPLFVTRTERGIKKKIGLVSGGGAGHEPLHIGMVGFGMLDAACPGFIFSSPTPRQIVDAARAADMGKGLLFLVKNYSGDRMNFEMAAEKLAIPHDIIIISDETIPDGTVSDDHRRGLAGVLVFEKMLGALAESGAGIDACLRLGVDLQASVRSMGVVLRSGSFPGRKHEDEPIPEAKMEIGVGIHGEPGRVVVPLAGANEIAELLIESIGDDLALSCGDEILLFVNGMGGTPPAELYLLLNSAVEVCRSKKLKVSRVLVGNYVTSLDTAGCSFTLCRLTQQMISLWDYPVITPTLTWG